VSRPEPNVTVSTKTWEGDYRTILTPEGIEDLFGPLGRSPVRQVVLNRIEDVPAAEKLAGRLVDAGVIDCWAWAEVRWPELSRRLGLPANWFGAATPFSVPELCELDCARTDFLLHIAGDVRFDPPAGWLDRAVRAFGIPGASVITATPPAGSEWVRSRGRDLSGGWVETQLFSDQLFLARPAEILDGPVLRAEDPASAKYPKPGGALTFEARVGAWLASRGRNTLVDIEVGYLHPVSGREGDSYQRTPFVAPVVPADPPVAGPRYPATGSSPATGLVLSSGESYVPASLVAAAVASLGWCSRVVAVDVTGSPGVKDAARSAGAEVMSWSGLPQIEVARRQILGALTGWVVELRGNEICTAALAHRIARKIDENLDSGLEAASISRIGAHSPHRYGRGLPRRLVAYRTEGLTFGQPLDGYPVAPAGSVTRIPPTGDALILSLEAPDLRGFVDDLNERSSWRAESMVLDRGPGIRMPLERFVRSYLGGRWRYGRLGPKVALLEAFEEWLTIQKWREGIAGGRTASIAEVEQEVLTELTRDDAEFSPPRAPGRSLFGRPRR
jgi:hypothetical protein